MTVKKGGIIMSTIVVKNGNVEGALRTMKQKNMKDGLLKAVRERNRINSWEFSNSKYHLFYG